MTDLPPGTVVYDPTIARELFASLATDRAYQSPEQWYRQGQLQAEMDARAMRLYRAPTLGFA